MVARELFARPYSVLVSDDDEGCRETVREALAGQGYEMRLACCGREAIEVARSHLVHVLIVDMNMPDMTGLDTVTVIRREISMRVPSILMSADASRELMSEALAAEFDSFIAKPFDLSALRHVVEVVLRRHYESDGF
jgi:DNA-binding response OmpR family regulator